MIARILAASVALTLTLAASGAAMACQGKAVATLDDTFRTPDPGWGPPDQAAAFTPGGLVLKPPVNGSAWRWNMNYTMDGSDLCVSVANPSHLAGRADLGDVGVRFWAKSAQNFYTATVSLDGTVAIDRLVNGVWHVVLPPTPSAAVRTQPGAINQVEISVKGSAGSFYVNGAKITDFRGEAPAQGGPPGVYAESGGTAGRLGVPARPAVLTTAHRLVPGLARVPGEGKFALATCSHPRHPASSADQTALAAIAHSIRGGRDARLQCTDYGGLVRLAAWPPSCCSAVTRSPWFACRPRSRRSTATAPVCACRSAAAASRSSSTRANCRAASRRPAPAT